MSAFRLGIDYKPRGDQPTAIDSLLRGLRDGDPHQVLLGVTGSGKTFTMAKVIEECNRPAPRARPAAYPAASAPDRLCRFAFAATARADSDRR